MGIVYGTLDLPSRKENYELVEGDRTESADVCIIGSGAAGAVLAKELAEVGKKIILLERGGYYEGKDMNQNDLDMMPLLWKNSGAQFDDNLQIVIAQGSCLGGSTVINDAVCFDFPQPIIKEWRAMGINFTDEEIRTHTEKVNQILHVSEVKDVELNQNNKMLRDGAEAIGLHHHGKNRRNCVSCMQCGFCHLGCHYETKQDVLQTYIHRALNESGSDVSIFCNCYVEKLIYQNGRVVGVAAKFRDKAENNLYELRVKASKGCNY